MMNFSLKGTPENNLAPSTWKSVADTLASIVCSARFSAHIHQYSLFRKNSHSGTRYCEDTLRENELVKELSYSLRSGDEETPLDILSNLTKLQFSGESNEGDAFAPFIKERQAVGHPVNLSIIDPSEYPSYIRP
jgi:hypothetical protein